MSSTNDLSKSTERFTSSASGVKFSFKNKKPFNQKKSHKEFYNGEGYSVDIEIEEKPEISGKHKNPNKFRPSTKQTVDQNKFKKLKEKYDIEEIEEKIEEEQKDTKGKNDEKNSNSNSSIRKSKERNDTPPSRIRKNIYTEQYKPNKKIITDDEDEEEINNFDLNQKDENENKKDEDNEEKEFDLDNLDNSIESEKEEINRNKNKNKKNNKKNKKKNTKEENESDKDKSDKDDKDKEKEDNNSGTDNDKDNDKNIKKKKNQNKNKTKQKKFNEEEYQKLLSESKDYNPFKDYDINKFILTLSQMNNIKHNPDLYKKYNNFLSLKKKQDKIQFDTLLKNILLIFNNLTKKKYLQTDFKVNSLFKNFDFSDYDFKSSEKTAYFDLFLAFISIYISDYESFIESTSISDTNKLVIPFHALAFIFSSQLFFCDIAKLMQSYYDKFLSYKIIPIYKKENEDFLHKINTRHIIWKQFEAPFLFYKNNKKLYLKSENGEKNLDEKKVEEFGNEINNNCQKAYNTFVDTILEKHGNINVFNLNDKRINLTDKINSVPSSLYNQINGDIKFKLKMNLYKYKMKQLKIKKLCKLNDAMIKKRRFNDTLKNNIFKQSVYYMNSCDVVQDFLDNYS